MTIKPRNEKASFELFEYLAKSLKFDGFSKVVDAYENIVKQYLDSALIVMSNISFEKLDGFDLWLRNATIDKKQFLPYLISNMLEGDIYSVSLYDSIQKYDNHGDLVLDYKAIYSSHEIKRDYKKFGGGEDARAKITAEHWLKSGEAAEFLGGTPEGAESLCLVNDLLHIHNGYVECGD